MLGRQRPRAERRPAEVLDTDPEEASGEGGLDIWSVIRALETLAAVRAVYDGPIRVDANTGWTLEEGKRLLPDLVRFGVELIEQPFPARRLDQLAALQAVSPLPIVADGTPPATSSARPRT